MSACDLGLDVTDFGMNFGKRKGLTTNPATRPFWVVAGSGIDVKGKFSKSEFVERFPEFSLFYRLFSPLDSEMICIFPYFYPCEESAREIREIFI